MAEHADVLHSIATRPIFPFGIADCTGNYFRLFFSLYLLPSPGNERLIEESNLEGGTRGGGIDSGGGIKIAVSICPSVGE